LIMQQAVGSVFIHKDHGGTRVLLRHPTASTITQRLHQL